MKTTAKILIASHHVVAIATQRRHQSESSVAVQDVESPLILHESIDWAEVVDAITAAVDQMECIGASTQLIVPSSWGYISSLNGHQKRFDRHAANFEMEAFLPVPLESVTIGYSTVDNNVIGVAVSTEPIKALLDDLQAKGVRIDHIWVDLFVASSSPLSSESSKVVIRDAGRFASLETTTSGEQQSVIRNTLLNWSTDGATEDTSVHPTEPVPTEVVFDLSVRPSDGRTEKSARSRNNGNRLGPLDLLMTTFADSDAPDLCVGELAPPNRFERAHRQLIRVAALGLMLIATLFGDAYGRHQACMKQIDELRGEEVVIYRSVISNGAMPSNPSTRLASERKRIEALASTSSAGPASRITTRSQPLDDLRTFVASLPQDVRIFANEIVVDDRQLTLRGQTVGHRDAERIADAVASLDGVEVAAPRTSRLKNGGVEFGVRGKRDDATPN